MDYVDHIGMWRDELRDWLPDTLFDAHVHLGPSGIVAPLNPERLAVPLCTFTNLTWEELLRGYASVYSGKRIGGLIAFGFPQREVDIDRANAHIVDLMLGDLRVHGFLLSDPFDTRRAVAAYAASRRRGAPFRGVKPYCDRLGTTAFETTMGRYIPDDLLEFMNGEGLVMMLHTSGHGMGDADNQAFVRRILETYPRIRIVLAHMGRYTAPKQFESFVASGLLRDYPALYLETSSATEPAVYEQALSIPNLRTRLVFGSDFPFGLITGIERWSEKKGAIFLSRDDYAWSDPGMQREHSAERTRLTYNTYHAIAAVKSAIDRMSLSAAEQRELKEDIFFRNGVALLE